MDFQWILLAFLLVSVIAGAVRAIWRPIMKNVLRLVCIPIAFLIAWILQTAGVFKMICDPISSMLIGSMLKIPNAPDTKAFATAAITSVISAIIFVIVFFIVLMILRLALANPISKVIDKAIKKKSENSNKKLLNGIFKGLSALSGAICGFLLLGVSLMPIFYIVDLSSSAIVGTREHQYQSSSISRVVTVIDEKIVAPYEKSFTASIYKTLGISDLMSNTAAEGSVFTREDGTKVNAAKSLKNLLSHGLDAAVLFEAQKMDGDDLGKDIDALMADPALRPVLAELFCEYSDQLFKSEQAGEGTLMDDITSTLRDHYKTADKATVSEDIAVIGDAFKYLCHENMFSRIDLKTNGVKGFAAIIEDEELLGGFVEILADISPYDSLIKHIYEYEISGLTEILDIPQDDAEAYDVLLSHLINAANSVEENSFNIENVYEFAEKFATSGLPITTIDFSDKTAGSDAMLYQDWKAYKDAWNAFQDAFSASCEDTTIGKIWVKTDSGNYFYDSESYTWTKSDVLLADYSTVAPLSQYFVECSLSRSGSVNEDILLNWLFAFDSDEDNASVALALKLLNRENFKSEAVTIEVIKNTTHFDLWDEQTRVEDSKTIIKIWSKLNVITAKLPADDTNHDTEYVRKLISQFGTLGEMLDLMHDTTCFPELPREITVGMLQNDLFRKYINAGIIAELNDAVENDDTISYSSFMNSLKSLISLVIDKLEDLGGVIK